MRKLTLKEMQAVCRGTGGNISGGQSGGGGGGRPPRPRCPKGGTWPYCRA